MTKTDAKPRLSPFPRPQALLLFTTAEMSPAKPVAVSLPALSPSGPFSLGQDGWETDGGCVADNVAGRLLKGPSTASDAGMPYAACMAYCFDKGFQVAGLE